MGYYADTTKKLMDQIGEPYKTTVQGGAGLDLSSLLMALMFMPKMMGKGATPGVEGPPMTSDQYTGMFGPNVHHPEMENIPMTSTIPALPQQSAIGMMRKDLQGKPIYNASTQQLIALLEAFGLMPPPQFPKR